MIKLGYRLSRFLQKKVSWNISSLIGWDTIKTGYNWIKPAEDYGIISDFTTVVRKV
jgi:hypothetical protein